MSSPISAFFLMLTSLPKILIRTMQGRPCRIITPVIEYQAARAREHETRLGQVGLSISFLIVRQPPAHRIINWPEEDQIFSHSRDSPNKVRRRPWWRLQGRFYCCSVTAAAQQPHRRRQYLIPGILLMMLLFIVRSALAWEAVRLILMARRAPRCCGGRHFHKAEYLPLLSIQ